MRTNGMNNSEYQALRYVSSHWLIAILDSPAACWRKYLAPQRETISTDALRLGTLVHCLALTPNQLEHEFVVADYERRSSAGKARYAVLADTGKIVIRPAELERARAMVAALRANPDSRKLLHGGKKEFTVIQRRRGGLLPLKARLDIHHASSRGVVELKTTRDLSMIEKSMERYRYPLSAAFYREIVRGDSVTFVWVQSVPPHDVLVVPMSAADLRRGDEMRRTALDKFDACWEKNEWPEAPALGDDPLMMDFMPSKAAGRAPRFELRPGELHL